MICEVLNINKTVECRIGKFKVARKIVEQSPCNVAKVLAKMKFVPVRVELLFSCDAFEYVGHSSLFDDLTEAEIIPEYTIKVSTRRSKNGYDTISVSVERIAGFTARNEKLDTTDIEKGGN